jgi:hypothetical protein
MVKRLPKFTIHFASELKKLISEPKETASTLDSTVPTPDATGAVSEAYTAAAEDFDESRKIAKKVNLFRIQTTYGVSANLEYFYNAGTLSGDDLMEQLLRVILLCEIVFVMIVSICSDAGGSNSGLFSALRKGRSLEGKVWLDDNLISFQHPFDPGRRIGIITCFVHGQKACRNNLLKSQEGGKRGFVRHNIKFGWQQVIDLYGEDKTNQTRLTKPSIDPDRFSKMGVVDSLAPF